MSNDAGSNEHEDATTPPSAGRHPSARFDDLMDLVGDAVVLADPAGTVSRINPAAAHLLRVPESEAIGMPIGELLTLRIVDDTDRRINLASMSSDIGEATLSGVGALTDRGLDQRVSYSMRQVGSVAEPAILLVLRDATDEPGAPDSVRRHDQFGSLGELAGGIAHDFNNMLTAILGAADLLEESSTEQQDIALLSIIQRTCLRGADLVARLVDSGQHSPGEFELIAVEDLLLEVRDLLELSSPPQHIKILAEELDDSPVVRGDRSALQNALLNVGLNAVDAIDDEGVVHLEASLVGLSDADCVYFDGELVPGSYVEIRITDNGAGMSPAVKSRIFDLFFTTKPAGKGSGLGLAATRSTVLDHRGTIRAYSTPGVGTTFQLFLPAGSDHPD